MFNKLFLHLTKYSNQFLKPFYSPAPPTIATLNLLFILTELQLSTPNHLPLAIKSFKSCIKIASEIFPQDHLQQSYWCVNASLHLISKNYFKESEEFLQESIHLLSQHDPNNKQGELCKIYLMVGSGYYYLKDYIKSEDYYTKALLIAYTNKPEYIIILLENLIKIKTNLSKFKEGLDLCERALGCLENFENNNEQIIVILAFYGKCLGNLNEHDKAIKEYKKSIKLIELRGKEVNKDFLLLNIYEALISILIYDGNEEQAVQVTLEAVGLIEKWFGTEKSLEFCEFIYLKFKNIDFEEPIAKKIVEMSEKAFPGGIENARSYSLAEDHYHRKGNLAISLEYAKNSMKIAEKFNDSDLILKSCERLGSYYLKTDPELAKTYIEQGKKMLDSTANSSKQIVLEYLHFQYYSIIKDYKNASKSIETCINLTPETKLTANDLIKFYLELSDLHYDYEQSEKSLSSLFDSLEIIFRYFTTDYSKTSEILSKIGSMYAEKNEFNKSVEYLSRALEIEKNSELKSFFLLLAISTNLMRSYININRLDLGLNVGVDVLKLIEERNESANIQLGIFYLCFSDVYFRMNKMSSARTLAIKGKEAFSELKLNHYISIAEDCLVEIESAENSL